MQTRISGAVSLHTERIVHHCRIDVKFHSVTRRKSLKFECTKQNIYGFFLSLLLFALNLLHHRACLRLHKATMMIMMKEKKKKRRKCISWWILLKSLNWTIFFIHFFHSSFALELFGFQHIKSLFVESIIKGNCTSPKVVKLH